MPFGVVLPVTQNEIHPQAQTRQLRAENFNFFLPCIKNTEPTYLENVSKLRRKAHILESNPNHLQSDYSQPEITALFISGILINLI